MIGFAGIFPKTNFELKKFCVKINLVPSFFADQAHNVTIHNKEMSLRGGAQHEFTCEALGSRPAAVITWWLDDFQIQPELDDIQIVRTILGNVSDYIPLQNYKRTQKNFVTIGSLKLAENYPESLEIQFH